jgi:hypothetical protein
MIVRPISLFQWLIVVAFVVLTGASFVRAEDRFALIIGNSNYREDDSFPTLPNAVSDSELLGSALKKAGYSVVSVTNCTAEEIRDSVRNFSAKLPINGETAFFFSGHGFQVEKEPCLLGIDASVSDEKMTSNTVVPIASIIEQITARKPRVSLFFLDCCRELALVDGGKQAAIPHVLGSTYENYPEMLISFSSEPGGVAFDGRELGLPNSPYCDNLARGIADGLELNKLMTTVRREVFRITGGRQRTWDSSSMVGDYFFSEKGFTLRETMPTDGESNGSGDSPERSGRKLVDWDIIQYRGFEYVDVENIARFYGFERLAKKDGQVELLHPSMHLRLVEGGHELYMNNILYFTSFPMPSSVVPPFESTTLITTVDLAKLLDPVVRPVYTQKAKTPKFAFLFDETRITAHDNFSSYFKSLLAETSITARVLISDSEKERSEWLTKQSEEEGMHVIYFRLDVPGIPSNGIRAMTMAPKGTPPTGESAIEALPFPVLANEYDRQNIALATALYSHLVYGLKKFEVQQLGVGRTQRSEMRAIGCPAALIEMGRPSDGLRAASEELARSIINAAVRYVTSVGVRG